MRRWGWVLTNTTSCPLADPDEKSTCQPPDPRNPFRTNVVPGYAGQAINYYYLPSDIPGTEQISKNETARLVLGLNGKLSLLGRDWSWALDASSDYNRRYAFAYTPGATMAAIDGTNTPQDLALYNIFADHDALPNTAAATALARSSTRENSDFVWQSEVNARANGELFALPAGLGARLGGCGGS